MKVGFVKNSNDYSETESDLDSIVKGFCMLNVRTNGRSSRGPREIDIPLFKTKLLKDNNFAYDTGRQKESLPIETTFTTSINLTMQRTLLS